MSDFEHIKSILATASDAGASDVIVEASKRPSIRSCGEIKPFGSYVPTDEEVNSFRRMVAGENGEAVYGKEGSFDVAYSLPGGEDGSSVKRFRLNFFTTFTGPSFVARPLRDGSRLDVESLNLPKILEKLCLEQRGIILVTGSTGSGKSTALSAMVNFINQNSSKHILTIEDPIEFVHADAKSVVSQREVTSGTGGFSLALRSALRENPDVIVIGELRDAETAAAAISAAMTGHLVISTLHTSDTIQSVERLISMFPEDRREQVAIDFGMALNAVISLRLLKEASGSKMRPACELLIGTPSVRKLVSERDYGALEELLSSDVDSGMMTFRRSIFKLYRDGTVSLETAREAVTNKEEFDLLVRGMESSVDAFKQHYGSSNEMFGGEFTDMRTLLKNALTFKASDLILSAGSRPTLRINGYLRPLDLPVLSGGDVQKLLFSVITRRQRIEFEEKKELDFALSVSLDANSETEKKITSRFRINGFYQRGYPGVVARVVNTVIPTPAELALPEVLVKLIQKQQGLILVTGPTGSGKSTTLACLIDCINRVRHSHVITIEDPIEYVHGNIKSIVEQREVHADTLGFSTALKYALRQDPDVIMVGEMRDIDTMAAAITAAETGHLVLATIHTNSAPQTIDRIVDSFPAIHQNQIRLQLAGVLLGVVSQRLLPRVDRAGRVAAFEIMIGTPPVLALVRDGKTHQLQSVMETSTKDGMITLEKAMEELYENKKVAIDEIKRYRADYKQVRDFR